MTPKALSLHVLQALASAQQDGRTSSLETLVESLRVRRADLRRTVSALHQEGLVDAARMRLSLQGFAIGTALIGKKLPPLRRAASAAVAA